MEESKQTVLPILSKVIDKKLMLKDYTLRTAHIRGLSEVIIKTELEIDSIMLDNCGIDDT